jgi:hypothetical protein
MKKYKNHICNKKVYDIKSPMKKGNNFQSGFQSLVGMGVATVRLVAAVLTVLGVWIHLDTLRKGSVRPENYKFL